MLRGLQEPWRGKCIKMAANNSKSYFHLNLNKLVDEYNNTYHPCIGRLLDADYSALTEEIIGSFY